MKHLLLLAVVIVAFQAIATSAIDTILFKQHGSIQYSDGVLSNDIIEQLKLDMSLSEQQKSHRGHITVDNNIFQRIKDVAGSAIDIDIDDLIDANTGGVKLQTRFIDQSTQPHVDRYHHNGEVVDDDVMFVALDSNPDAHFTHGDSSIPAVAGRLFRFNGSIKHGTTFNGGNPIRLLGPFSTKNFASVGLSSCPLEGICIDSANMITGVGTTTACNLSSEECYESFDDSTVGCPINGNGVCVTISGMAGVFDGIGDGNPCSNSDPDSDCYVCTSCSKKVFVTSETYQGDLGGVSGANAKCQELACSAGLVGNFKAWISDETSNPANANTFFQSASFYFLVTNLFVTFTIAGDFADLTDGTIINPINRDENGDLVSGNLNVWTNTNTDGTTFGIGSDCMNWNSNSPDNEAQVGDASATNNEWTLKGKVSIGELSCDQEARLYCFQQDDTDACSTPSPTSSPTSAPSKAPSNAPTLSKSGKTTSAKAKSVKTSKEESPDLDDLIAVLIVLLPLLNGNPDSMNLGAMLEEIQAEGGIHGRRILEDKEDLKALLTSLLEEKLDLDE